jgi:hypothetical protein
MRLSEMLDAAFWIYQRSAGQILVATALPVSLFWAAAAYATEIVFPSLAVTRTDGGTLDQISEAVTSVSLGLLVAVPLAALGLGYSMARTIEIVVPKIRGDRIAAPPLPLWTAAGVAARVSVVQLLYTGGFLLLCGALAAAGAALQFITGQDLWSFFTGVVVVFALTFGWVSIPVGYHVTALAVPAALIEGLKPRQAVRRSSRLLRSAAGQTPSSFVTFPVALLLTFLGSVVIASLSAVFAAGDLGTVARQAGGPTLFGPILEAALLSLPAYVAVWLLAPVWAILTTLLYFDRIVRLEAYDIRMLLEDIRASRKRTVLLP